MFKGAYGSLRPRNERKELLLEKLKCIDNTNKISDNIKNENIEGAILYANEIKLDEFIINKIRRLL